MCHGACSDFDRMFASVIKKILDWMLEPANSKAKIYIQIACDAKGGWEGARPEITRGLAQ